MKRAKSIFFLILIISSNISLAFGATNEGYGEDSTALGQFVDNYSDLGNVSVIENVVRNSTYDAMELNYTALLGGDEDFTTWTEYDPDNDLTVSSLWVNYTTQRSDSQSNMYKDFGIAFFGNFQVNFTFEFKDGEAGDASNRGFIAIFEIGNGITSGEILASEGVIIRSQQSGATDDVFRWRLRQRLAGGWSVDIQDATVYPTGTYYVSLSRIGTTVRLLVFSDEAHTVTLEDISGVGDATAYQYALATVGLNQTSDVGDHSTGTIRNLDLNISADSGFSSSGYFTTVDYLSDPFANGSILVQMTNTTIPANTAITMEFSEDNITWTFNDWQPIFGGLESIDLRDLNWSTAYYIRYNLSTTDSNVTPRVYQSRLITTIGSSIIANETFIIQNVTGEWVSYNLSIINTVTGTLDSGNLASTLDIDGNAYNVSEVVGVPGFIINYTWVGVDNTARCLWITMYVLYDGNLAHDIHIELYNHTSSSWVEIGVIDDDVAYEWHNVTIYALRIPNDFVNGTGAVFGRLNHVSAGNINHDISIEYLKLHAFIPSDVSVTGGINSATILMLILLFALAILTYLGVKRR